MVCVRNGLRAEWSAGGERERGGSNFSSKQFSCHMTESDLFVMLTLKLYITNSEI